LFHQPIQVFNDFNCKWNLYLLCEFHQILKHSALWKFDYWACLEYNSNLKLKLLFAIHFYSCTISMLSSCWINLIKEENLQYQMIDQLECWYTNFQQFRLSMEFAFMVWISSSIECRNSNLGLATKAKGLQEGETRRRPGRRILYSWECRRVWENEPSHSQGNSHLGSWSLEGFPNL
jgi:hypothetical protein